MSDYLIHSGKLGMKWYHHDKDAYQTKSGNWVYGRNKPSGSRNLIVAKTGSKTTSANSKITGADDILDDAVKANVVGKRAKYSPSRNRNCVSCAIAYDLRRAGNKVQSIETAQGMSAFVVADIYKKTKTTDYVISAKRTGSFKSLTKGMTDSEFDSMVNYLKSDGENTRGIVMVNWKSKHGENYAGGHAMNYEVKNGKFYLVDGQIGKVYDEKNARKQLSNAFDVMTLRTDNRRVNLDYAKSYFVEPEGTKITAPSKGLHVANTVSKVGMGLAIGGAAANASAFGLSFIHPAFFAIGMGSTAAAIGGTYASMVSQIAAQKIIENNRKETAAKMVERLTGNKVDRKMLSANTADLLKRIPEYNRVYNMSANGKQLDEAKIIPTLKTTDSDNTVNNIPNRNRVAIPVALPTGRNIGDSSQIRNTRNKLSDKERENIKKQVARARETGEYDMEFLERNLDIDPRTDKQFRGKAMDKAYTKYLTAEYLKSKSNGSSNVASQAGRNISDSSQIRNTSNKTVDKERENIKKQVTRARETGKYDMEFLEKGLDVDQRTGKLLKGKALDKAYTEYLKSKSNSNRASKPVAAPTGRNTSIGITSSQKGSMKSLYAKGVPIDEIAEKLGVSPSTVSKYLK